MQRFFVDPESLEKDKFEITDTVLVHQINNVLRMKAGDHIECLDSKGALAKCEVQSLSKRYVDVKVLERDKCEGFEDKLNLYFGMPNKMSTVETILKMCTEIGVNNFYPLLCARSQMNELKKVDRLENIIREAAEQSERCYLPVLHEVQNLDGLNVQDGLNIVCAERTNSLNLSRHPAFGSEAQARRELVSGSPKSKTVSLFIGPEGGWADDEIKFFEDRNFQFASLGKQILRMETACAVGCGIIRSEIPE